MGADFRFGGLSGILGFWLCFVIDSFAQVSRPTLFFAFSCLFGCALPCYFALLSPHCRRPHYFCPYFHCLRNGIGFKKIVLRGFVGKLQDFYAWEVVQKC
ncbi:hypothetical protein [Helicobacter cinaedi]|uniref:hypothetical protein n=1 Tax=Helicobacter cinaedi TaxID=213 RepID=UPI0015F29F3E|nr:hypothetical protein [Helicobacter cinaedi]